MKVSQNSYFLSEKRMQSMTERGSCPFNILRTAGDANTVLVK